MKKLIALLLVLALALSVAACGTKDETPDTTGSTGSTDTTDTTEKTLTIDDLVPGVEVFTKISYSASDDEILAARDTVVATCGETELTLGVLQMYYWMEVYDFLNQYSAYLSYLSLDYTVALDQQICPNYTDDDGNPGTWQQYFLESAISRWHSNQAMALMGAQKNVEMDSSLKETLDGLHDSLEKTAKENDLESVDALLQADVGAGACFDDYYAYTAAGYQGYAYYEYMYESFVVSDEDIDKFYAENEEDLVDAGYGKDDGNYYDVRHILIQPEGGTKDDDGNTTFSDDEWETCRQKAQALLDAWLAGEATEDTFAALAEKESMDEGSSSDGGLYSYLDADTNFVQEFKDWYLDESRQVGDTGLVKTEYGYHIMYFSGSQPIWYAQCREGVFDSLSQDTIQEAMTTFPMNMDYEKILLSVVDLAPNEE